MDKRDLTMFFIVKVSIRRGPGPFSDENIVKVTEPSHLSHTLHSQGLHPLGISSDQEKNFVGCPFVLELGVRPIVAEKRERL